MPKNLTPAQKKQAEAKLRRRYKAEKEKHDRQNRRRKIKVDWPYEDFLDWVARLGHLVLDLGEWGVVSIADWIDSWFGECDEKEGEFKGTYPSWHEKAGEEVCVKCPAGTYFAGWDQATGSPICARYTEDQEGYVPRPQDEVQDPVPPPARSCLEDGGFPTYSPKLGKNICVMCPDGGVFVGFDDNGDPVCGEPNPAPETMEEKAGGGMQKRRRRVRRKPKSRRPKRKSVTTKGTRRKRKAETPEERRERIKRTARLSPEAKKRLLELRKQREMMEKAQEDALRKKAEKEAQSKRPLSPEEQYRMQFIETFGHEEESR